MIGSEGPKIVYGSRYKFKKTDYSDLAGRIKELHLEDYHMLKRFAIERGILILTNCLRHYTN